MRGDDLEPTPSTTDRWTGVPIDRRTALGVLGAAGLAGLLAACSGDDTPSTASSTTTAAAGDGPLDPQGMPELDGEVRDLHLHLVAAPATATIVAGTETDVLSFQAEVLDGDPASVTPSRSYLGPTLHLRTGQRVRVDFDNEIDQDCIVHWHGLVLPQLPDGDERGGRAGPARPAGAVPDPAPQRRQLAPAAPHLVHRRDVPGGGHRR